MFIPHNLPFTQKSDYLELEKNFNNLDFTKGKLNKNLEFFFNERYFKKGHSVAVSSGSAALYLGILAISKGEKLNVLIPSYTCSAVLNAVLMANCRPLIADIDINSLTIDTDHRHKNIDLIIAVNVFGKDPDIKNLKKKYPKSSIILDSCHSIGRVINKNDHVYQCDAVIYSFYSTKIINSGHGGLVWSKKKSTIDFIKDFINFDQRKKYKKRFNFLLTDFQLAIIINQIKKLKNIRRKRSRLNNFYRINLPQQFDLRQKFNYSTDMIYRTVIKSNSSKNILCLKKYLLRKNIETIVPIKKAELLHNYLNLDIKNFKNAEDVSKNSLSLPCYFSMDDNKTNYIKKVFKDFEKNSCYKKY